MFVCRACCNPRTNATPALAKTKAADARMHFKTNDSGNFSKVMRQHMPNTTLLRIGGPPNGSYTGTKTIRPVRKKFSHAAGGMTDKVSDVVAETD